jgi:hypothetical protein
MNNITISNNKKIKLLNLIKKMIINSFLSKKSILNKYKKKFFLLFNNRTKNLMKNFYKFDICFIYKILIIGLKINPALANIKVKFNQHIFKKISIQMLTNIKLFQFRKFINISSFLRFNFSKIRNIKQKNRFYSYSISKSPEIFFEETADEIKFVFNTKFIKLFLFLNLALGRCWLMLKSSFIKILNFWKTYVNSCYNLMTRCKKNFELNQYKYDNNISINNNDQKNLDFEIFYLKKNEFTNFYFKITENPRNFSFELDFDKSLTSLNDGRMRWRNRHKNNLFIFNKNLVKPYVKNRFILLIY